MSESRFYRISPAGKLTGFGSAAEALAPAPDGGFVWLDFSQPAREELLAVMEPLGLHPLSIEDCFDDNQVPKMEDYHHNTFILFNAFDYADGQLSVDEIDLFIGQDYVVTVSGAGPHAGRPLAGIEEVVARELERVRQGPAFLLHAILDHIVDRKFTALESLEDELDTMEEAIMASVPSFRPGELIRRRRYLAALRKSIFHEREILTRICRGDCPFVPEKAIYHYRDVYDHLAKFFEQAENCRELVASLMEIHLSLLNNRMARAAQQTNATVRRLTLITTIFMPLGFLAGFFGMSEWTMMTGQDNWRIAYPVFLVAMVMLAVANYYLLARMGKRQDYEDPPA